jgi:TetR/AcrR family transcriptional regulator, transcriptional repressor of aconitase
MSIVMRPTSIVKNERSFYNAVMPKVSSEHRAAQRQRILDAARRCFMREGFHATSMQDILTAAQLSAGGLYLYFKSKEEIIEAIAVDTLAFFTATLEELFASDDLPPLDVVLSNALRILRDRDREQPTFRVVVQVWGEVGRAPRLATQVAEAQMSTRALLGRFIEGYQARGDLDPDAPVERIAQMLIAIMMGYVAQCALLGDTDVDAFVAGLRPLLDARLRAP